MYKAHVLCLLGSLLKVIHEVGNILIVVISSILGGPALVLLSDLLEVGKGVGTELIDDAGKQLLQLLGLGRATDDVGVGCYGSLHLGISKVNNGLILENIDLFDSRNGIDAETLQGILKPFVIRGGCFVHGLLL